MNRPLRGELIELDLIRVDGGTQSRSGLDQATVDAYADAYRDGAEMPPVVLFLDGEHYWLADGFHRYHAANEAELAEIEADVRQGTRRDAVLFACGANASHGLRRTRADKRRAVTALLTDAEWSRWSDRAIAEACVVSDFLVRTIRDELTASSRDARDHTRIGRDGRAIDTSAIGDLPEVTASSRSRPPANADNHSRAALDGPPASTDASVRTVEGGSTPPRPHSPREAAAAELYGVPDIVFPQASDPCPAPARLRIGCEGCPPGEDEHHWRVYDPPGEAAVEICRHCKAERPMAAEPPDNLEPEIIPERQAAAAGLPDDERAENDAYWTPDAHALACLRWLLEQRHGMPDTFTAVEPAVGGGAWLRALRALRPDAVVDRMDLDKAAPGLGGARRGVETAFIGRSWLDELPTHPHVKRRHWDLCIGNPPYGGDLVRWLDVSLERADIVAYLLRETATGSAERLPWWTSHRPTYLAKVLPRPRWEGPGQREASDYSDSVFVVWVSGLTDTRWDWIDARQPA